MGLDMNFQRRHILLLQSTYMTHEISLQQSLIVTLIKHNSTILLQHRHNVTHRNKELRGKWIPMSLILQTGGIEICAYDMQMEKVHTRHRMESNIELSIRMLSSDPVCFLDIGKVREILKFNLILVHKKCQQTAKNILLFWFFSSNSVSSYKMAPE